MITELAENLAGLKDLFARMRAKMDLDSLVQKRGEYQSMSGEKEFWDDQAKAQKIMRALGHLDEQIQTVESIQIELDSLYDFIELDDESLGGEIEERMTRLGEQIHALEFVLSFGGRYDNKDAIVSIHAGAGGTDAQDWAEILLRMYMRYFDSKQWDARILSSMPGEEAGLKSADIEVKGELVYGHLKAEHGVHRLVRLSPFNTKHTRETSFALLEVVPLLEDVQEIEISDDDLKIDVYRSSGHGGQSVNTTDSAVRITHIPTGIVVTCQNERSQLQNKQIAMRILKSKLAVLQEKQKEKELRQAKGAHVQGSWGNQIRSYVMHPYTMVKDHRTEYEVSNVQAVLDGDLDEFVRAWLLRKEK